MHPGVDQMVSFYSGSLGHHTSHVLRHHIREIWPDLRGDRLLAYGFAFPYLKLLSRNTDRVMAFQPGQMGASHWESGSGNCTALVEAENLPLPDNAVDRLLLIHALEFLGDVDTALMEFWRVLSPGGRLLVVTPNRRSLWAATDNTPFGYGQPFSQRQLTKLLRNAGFAKREIIHALCFPPVRGRRSLAALRPAERIGRLVWPNFSGAIIVEAEKKTLAGVRAESDGRVRAELQPALPGLAS